MIDYFSLINEYYQPGTLTYRIFTIHAVLVTNKALQIGRHLHLSDDELTFIEEAAMLHDIGVCQVKSAKMACSGTLPYIAHGVAGEKILRQHGLEAHALVASRHVGVGLTKEEISRRQLPLPAKDFTPQSLSEQIITYADCFFSKRAATLWIEESPAAIKKELAAFGKQQVEVFTLWQKKFALPGEKGN